MRKCPNPHCGPINRPILIDAGVGTIKKCPVCHNFFDENNTVILERDLGKRNPKSSSEDEEDYNPYVGVWLSNSLK